MKDRKVHLGFRGIRESRWGRCGSVPGCQSARTGRRALCSHPRQAPWASRAEAEGIMKKGVL